MELNNEILEIIEKVQNKQFEIKQKLEKIKDDEEKSLLEVAFFREEVLPLLEFLDVCYGIPTSQVK